MAVTNNLIASVLSPGADSGELAVVRGKATIAERHADFLADESRLHPEPVERLYLPTSTREVSEAVRRCRRHRRRVLVSGARTGVVGGAVARGADAIVTLARMTRILRVGKRTLWAEAGLSLTDLSAAIDDAQPGRFYPVDPTETSASIGGNVATNASGARSFRYGPTRRWIGGLTAVLADGSILRLRRGQVRARGRTFRIKLPGRAEVRFDFPVFHHPSAKNTAGYLLRPNMDAVDLLIGSEGTLAIVTEVQIRTAPRPPHRLFLTVWARSEPQALALVSNILDARGLTPLAVEYFDPASIDLLRARRAQEGPRSAVPPVDPRAHAAVFLELPYRDEEALQRLFPRLERWLLEAGLDLEDTWSGLDERELRRMKRLRHALPETVNRLVGERQRRHPQVHKLSTDLAVPAGRIGEMLALYRKRLEAEAIEHVIFGHLGDSHLHVNMLPRDSGELERAWALYGELAAASVRLGGTIAAEHGVGRLKRHLMPLQYSREMLQAMRRLKLALDPDRALNPGVLLPGSPNPRATAI